jgi:serine/threonine protein kinase/tetratricopeptide (TPR) repeat protein
MLDSGSPGLIAVDQQSTIHDQKRITNQPSKINNYSGGQRYDRVLVPDNPVDQTSRGWRRALYEWLVGPAPATNTDASRASPKPVHETPARIGHYAIARKLGEGGMGVVYAAHDEKLERTVALKTISTLSDSDTARRRFWREARAAASVNHPNICQIHEIGEDAGTLFIAMELLEGESLADHLRRGPLRVSEAVPIAFGMLAALSALHSRGFIHRDLKPSNVFLTPHGVKLLDFGLARSESASLSATEDITRTDVVIGSPRYMSPEQALGETVDSRGDLFAVGAILFEMLAGRPAFGGRTIVDVLHATLHEQPPALTGSPAIAAVDRVIRRALAKRPEERFATADQVADELRALRVEGEDTRALARPLTRVVVLPFRVLRTDAETDFLAFSLPDAIATSLSSVSSLVVRSSATAARFAADAPDLKALAAEADVDRVVMGTLLRAGDQVRATAQLVEAPGGTLLTSHTVQSPLGELFALQDDIARRIVAALSLPLTGEITTPLPDAPKEPRAYELYLRANELARSYASLPQARDLYVSALELDPLFAPAWAHLGRCHRVIAKYLEGGTEGEREAEKAFERALALDPRLSVAHKFYAALQAEMGKAPQAVVRLLGEAARKGNDPELYAGLVHTCRYAGLFDESVAAHAEARRLDPHVATSVEQTLLMTCDIDQLIAVGTIQGGGDQGIRVIGLGLAGRRDEARELLMAFRQTLPVPAFQNWADYLMAWLEGRLDDMKLTFAESGLLRIQDDPEAIFMQGWMMCDLGAHEEGITHLQQAVAKGYYVAPTLARSHCFDDVRSDPAFVAVQADAEAGRQRALSAFRDAGGERLLGRPSQ